ncbi:methyltransferase [Dactylosporangium matsuzakiense]|uniref:Phenazine-specific methyltransferase n=1 Tax=Dactylosporangium matsuzakiense TaxID=53360 RepID=A0A9W6NNN2_9ACTN|nr:methyltransferase [Dactylosporangium matsuzakiense]UWZ40882.1 methyltransferase [Dactylosporangium matsuzakiense]GLL03491.1 phenazine-specific methyltransferase [Dactylosporangium matsuzakiense]
MTASERAARQVIDVATGWWRAQAMHAAVTLGLPDAIGAGAATLKALTIRLGADPDRLARLLRLLAAIGLVTEDGDGYHLTPAGRLLRTDVPGSMNALCRVYGEEFARAWEALPSTVLTGEPGFTYAHGRPLGDYLRAEPAAATRFQGAMSAGNLFFADVATAFDFGSCARVIDVAGGNGALLATILSTHPHLYGTVVDQPHVVPLADALLTRELGRGRHEARAGDVFAAVPPGADAYVLSRVLQDWDDEHCVQLLDTCRRAMLPHARLLVVERVIPEADEQLLPVLWDVHLMVVAGGRERTLPGYRSLLAAAGLHLEAVHPLALETSLLIAAPAHA